MKTEEFIAAARDGDIAAIKRIIPNIANINEIDSSGVTALIVSSGRGFIEIVKLLLEHGADPNLALIDTNITPLFAATAGDNLETVKLLLNNGANPNSLSAGQSPLFVACAKRNAEIAVALMQKGADPNFCIAGGYPLLFDALGNGYYDIAKLLLQHKGNPDIFSEEGCTALMGLSAKGDLSGAQILIESGAQINLKAKDTGFTALHLAALSGHTHIAEVLIKHNIDTSIKDAEGNTAREYAEKFGFEEIVKLLK